MSIQLMSSVWKTKMKPIEKLVFLALADNANDDGVCWPSVSTIASKSCLSERTVQDNLKSLEDQGLIKRNYRSGRSTYYTVTDPRICRTPQEMHPAGGAPTPAGGAPPPPQVAHPEPSLEPSRISSRKKFSEFQRKLLANGVRELDLKFFADGNSSVPTDGFVKIFCKTRFDADMADQRCSHSLCDAFGLGKWKIEVLAARQKERE